MTAPKSSPLKKDPFVTRILCRLQYLNSSPYLYTPILEGLGMADVLGKFMTPFCLSRTDVYLIVYRAYPSN